MVIEEDGPSERPETVKKASDKYEQHWYYIADRIERVALRKDRLLVLGAGGALVLSITFLNQVAPTPEPWTLYILSISWAALLLALGAALWGWYATQKAHEKQQQNLLERALGTGDGLTNPWDRRTELADKTAFGSLFVGVALLAVFAIANLPWEGNRASTEEARPAAERVNGGESGQGREGVSDSAASPY